MAKKRMIVDISDARVTKNPDDVLVTYSLGSCIGVCIYEKATKTAAMIHYQLPESKIDPGKAEKEPFMFADTAIERVLGKLESMGINKKKLSIKVAGGSTMDAGPKGFDIGKRNYLALRKILWRKGIFIDSEDVGGNSPRNLYLNVEDGSVTVRSVGLEKKL